MVGGAILTQATRRWSWTDWSRNMKLAESNRRRFRKGLTDVGGAVSAVRKSVASIPAGVLESATEVFSPSTDSQTRSGRLRLAKLGSNLAMGAAAGGLVAGPAGAVVGLALSFVQTAISNVTEEVSGHSKDFQRAVRQRVSESLGDEKTSLAGKLKAVVSGTVEGCKSEWKHGKVSGRARTAGFMDGLKYARKIPKYSSGKEEEAPSGVLNTLARASRVGMGIVGSVLSFPGGLIVGGLEAVKQQDQDLTPTMKPLLRLCTGLGKAIIPGILGGVVAGPAGAAAATGVGLLFDIAVDGVNTISDGRKGMNTAIYDAIDDSLQEALSEDEDSNSGFGVYYRQGKGATVGARVGLAEGWKRGYYGGVEAVKALIESPFKAREDAVKKES